MKVMNIILEPRVGGPQLRIVVTAKYLKEMYHIETLVVFPEKNSREFKKILDGAGVDYRTLRLHKLSKHPMALLKWLIFLPIETRRLRKTITREDPAVVHCNGSWQWKGVLAAKAAGYKVVWHLNDTGMFFPVRLLFKRWMRYADGFIAAGSRVKDYYLNHFNPDKPVREIQAPVDTKTYDPAVTTPDEQLKARQGIKIITVGNVKALKGIEYFIDAAALLNKTYPGLHFVVVGKLLDSQQEYTGRLKRKIKKEGLDNFCFWGSSDDIPGLLKAADIYVCSSVSEASPLSVWEAMAMEKAVVSTDVGSVPDFLETGRNGFIVPPRDPGELAEKIKILIENPALRETFGKKARETALKELDVKITAKKHKEIYEKIRPGI